MSTRANRTYGAKPRTARHADPADQAPRHVIPLRVGRLRPDPSLAGCRDCQVSCQSACKTSCTVGNQRCPK